MADAAPDPPAAAAVAPAPVVDPVPPAGAAAAPPPPPPPSRSYLPYLGALVALLVAGLVALYLGTGGWSSAPNILPFVPGALLTQSLDGPVAADLPFQSCLALHVAPADIKAWHDAEVDALRTKNMDFDRTYRSEPSLRHLLAKRCVLLPPRGPADQRHEPWFFHGLSEEVFTQSTRSMTPVSAGNTLAHLLADTDLTAALGVSASSLTPRQIFLRPAESKSELMAMLEWNQGFSLLYYPALALGANPATRLDWHLVEHTQIVRVLDRFLDAVRDHVQERMLAALFPCVCPVHLGLMGSGLHFVYGPTALGDDPDPQDGWRVLMVPTTYITSGKPVSRDQLKLDTSFYNAFPSSFEDGLGVKVDEQELERTTSAYAIMRFYELGTDRCLRKRLPALDAIDPAVAHQLNQLDAWQRTMIGGTGGGADYERLVKVLGPSTLATPLPLAALATTDCAKQTRMPGHTLTCLRYCEQLEAQVRRQYLNLTL